MKMLDLLETIQAENASVQKLFASDGAGVRHRTRNAAYLKRLAEAAKLIADVRSGKRRESVLREAMTTDDFPYLFGDILDRQLLASYREYPVVWQNYAHRATVRDFRTVKRFSVYGADQALSQVTDENGEYPVADMGENSPYSYAVKKYGRKVPFSWETIINDDLGAFADLPERLGRAARRTEEKFATELYVDANGPHASFYTSGNSNIVTGNPTLSISALQTAMTVLSAQTDEDGEPIYIEAVELVVPPALEVVARNILNAIQLDVDPNPSAGTSKQVIRTLNWMKNRVRLSVNPYIPIVASSANGDTSWFLFASPGSGRPALELGFLRGHEEPEIFMKSPNATRVGGGADDFAGDFDTDSIMYKVRHVLGGTRMDPKMTVASNGSGS